MTSLFAASSVLMLYPLFTYLQSKVAKIWLLVLPFFSCGAWNRFFMKFEKGWLKIHISNGNLTWRHTDVCAGILNVTRFIYWSKNCCGKNPKHMPYACF
jgi:hypothetical protein